MLKALFVGFFKQSWAKRRVNIAGGTYNFTSNIVRIHTTLRNPEYSVLNLYR